MADIRIHPGDDLLSAFRAGTLSGGEDLAVQVHIELCDACNHVAFAQDAFDDEDPTLSEDALAAALQRLDEPMSDAPKMAASSASPDFLRRLALPHAIAAEQIGRRRWPAPGVWIAPIKLDYADARSRTYLIHVRGGMEMPGHSHKGRELTVVLSGQMQDETGLYAPGDMVTGDRHVHTPRAVSDCLCLVTAGAPVVMATLIGRLIQPLARI